jgi:NTE family protein
MTIQVMTHTITAERLKHDQPDLLIRPHVGVFQTLDFLQATAIFRAAEPIKAEIKHKLGALLEA